MKKKKRSLLNLNKKSISNLESMNTKAGQASDIVLTVIRYEVPISTAAGSCLSPCAGPWATYDCYVLTDDCIYV